MLRLGLVIAALSMSTGIKDQTAQESSKTFQFSKIVINPDIPKENQHVKVGTICLFAGVPINFGSGERTLNFERFERLFAAGMKERGFNVAAKSSNLFESESGGSDAAYLVGATIRPLTVDICDSIDGVKGKVTVSVEWKIYDRAKQQVVETISTQGNGQLLKFNPDGMTVIFDQAFSSSLSYFANSDVLKKYIGNGARPSQPSSSNNLSAPLAIPLIQSVPTASR